MTAISQNIALLINSEWAIVSGTSAAAPIWAGILSIINAHQMNKGRPPVGFVNPLLYHMAVKWPSAFVDITKGRISCGESCRAYAATKGWDAASGLGAPNVGEMLKYVDVWWESNHGFRQLTKSN